MRKYTELFLDRLKQVVYPDFVENIILFGSEVYGSPKMDSDIDLAIVCKSKPCRAGKLRLRELIESCNPPFDYQLTYVIEKSYKGFFDVRKDIFERGLIIL